jgi:hypothetical protein
MNEWIESIKNATLKQVLVVLLAIAPTLGAAGKGIWSVGVENYWWGNGHGKIERVQLCLMREYYGKPSADEKTIKVGDAKIFVKVYDSGDAMISRTGNGSLTWSLSRTQDEVLEKCESDSKKVVSLFASEAYAAEPSRPSEPSIPVQVEFTDSVLEWMDGIFVKVRRDYIDCYQILIINAASGQIETVLETTCK